MRTPWWAAQRLGPRRYPPALPRGVPRHPSLRGNVPGLASIARTPVDKALFLDEERIPRQQFPGQADAPALQRSQVHGTARREEKVDPVSAKADVGAEIRGLGHKYPVLYAPRDDGMNGHGGKDTGSWPRHPQRQTQCQRDKPFHNLLRVGSPVFRLADFIMVLHRIRLHPSEMALMRTNSRKSTKSRLRNDNSPRYLKAFSSTTSTSVAKSSASASETSLSGTSPVPEQDFPSGSSTSRLV